MDFLVYSFFLLFGGVISYVGLKFTTIKSLTSDLQNEIQEKNSMKEELFQLRTINLQNEQNEKKFESLASEILKKNTVELSQTNQKELETMLKPFKENLSAFGEKMEHVKTQNTELKTYIEVLKNSSDTLSQDAKNLTEALRGKSKTIGNWGEIILKRILESSGLEEGMNYKMQSHYKVDNIGFIPDCIVNLPENKNIIVDSKVSLVPLQNFYQAQDENERNSRLKELEQAIKKHIDDLDKKAYQDIPDICSADYVLMFMPVESAFNLMMSEFDNIMDYAWKKRVLIVSPSSLMVALRTVEMFWQQEKRNKTTDEIIRIASEFYNKFVGIIENLDGITGGVKKIQDNIDGVFSKMQGHGGMASQAQRLIELGAKTKKQIPSELIEVE